MPSELLRIIDANFNRAREALRTLEEYARFALDDNWATSRLKDIRHGLCRAIADLAPRNDLLASRDTPHDVGATLSTESESNRPDSVSVFVAAARRLAESLRALEEYGKVIEPQAGRRFEAWRYELYEIEKRLAFVNERHRFMRDARLYVLVTEALCAGDWLETIRLVVQAGAHVVQLREKELPDGELLERARQAAEVCRAGGALFILNDRPDVARLCKADGVHVGQEDLPVRDARRIVGPGVLVGISTHNRQQLTQAIQEDPDYIAVGPMFPTETKPQEIIGGPKLLALACVSTPLPIVAIGGIEAENINHLQASRPWCAAVCRGVIGEKDPAAAARQLLERTATWQ